MNNKIKKLRHTLCKNKAKGMVDDFLPTIVFLVIASILILVFINFNIAINKKDSINNLARDYLLLSETQGGLTAEDINNLAADLAAMGFVGDANQGPITMKNFNATADGTNTENTTMRGSSGVGYGEEIVLSICVYTNDERLTGTNIFNLSKEDKWLPIKIVYHSTSKQ